jgi:hypothetical protein
MCGTGWRTGGILAALERIVSKQATATHHVWFAVCCLLINVNESSRGVAAQRMGPALQSKCCCQHAASCNLAPFASLPLVEEPTLLRRFTLADVCVAAEESLKGLKAVVSVQG